MHSVNTFADKAKTGIWGLDDILAGGFSRGHLFLVEGAPGTGKTTIALQFLLDGVNAGEKCLYITLSETERELREGAASHGWSLGDGIEVFELLPPESLLDSEQQQSLLYIVGPRTRRNHRADFRGGGARAGRAGWCSTACPKSGCWRKARCATGGRSWRSSIISREFNTTVLLLDDLTAEHATRPCTASPMACCGSRNWRRPMAPSGDGARHQISRREVPRRLSRRHDHHRRHQCCFRGWWRPSIARNFVRTMLSSGIAGTGPVAGRRRRPRIEHADLGPAGTGKSLAAIVFIVAAIARGEKAALFVFDEELGLLFARMKGLGIDLEDMQRSGNCSSTRSMPPNCRPANSPHRVRKRVDEDRSRPW